jgi:hypothetical protein
MVHYIYNIYLETVYAKKHWLFTWAAKVTKSRIKAWHICLHFAPVSLVLNFGQDFGFEPQSHPSKETLPIVAGCWWLMTVILATQETEKRIAIWGQPRQIVCEILSWKEPTQKKYWWSVQVVERLPSKCEVPNSNPSTAKNQKTKHNKKIINFGSDSCLTLHVDFLSTGAMSG